MNAGFSQKLKMLMIQLNITSAQLARGLNVDPSLISRWLKQGCGERKAAEIIEKVGVPVIRSSELFQDPDMYQRGAERC